MNRREISRLLGLVPVMLAAAVCLGGDPGSGPRSQAPATPDTVSALSAKQLGQLQVEYARLSDALAAVQARLAVLEQKLFDSRLVVRVDSELDDGYRLEMLELEIDGAPVTSKEFTRPAPVQSLLLYDGHLEPGPHRLLLRLWVSGPDQVAGDWPGFHAASGMVVHLRHHATTRAQFDVELTGNAAASLRREAEPGARWSVDVAASFSTEESQ